MHLRTLPAIGWPKMNWFGAKTRQLTALPSSAYSFPASRDRWTSFNLSDCLLTEKLDSFFLCFFPRDALFLFFFGFFLAVYVHVSVYSKDGNSRNFFQCRRPSFSKPTISSQQKTVHFWVEWLRSERAERRQRSKAQKFSAERKCLGYACLASYL